MRTLTWGALKAYAAEHRISDDTEIVVDGGDGFPWEVRIDEVLPQHIIASITADGVDRERLPPLLVLNEGQPLDSDVDYGCRRGYEP